MDFTARVRACQTNKKIVTLRADWTNQDPRITAGIVLDAVKPAGDALTTGKAAALTKY